MLNFIKFLFKIIVSISFSQLFFVGFTCAAEDDYPTRRIIFIVPTEAGGDGDIYARMLLERVSLKLSQPIVVVNKPGAAGVPGYRDIKSAKPDGYTVGLGFPTLYMNKVQNLMPWDHNDFTLFSQSGSFIPVVVSTTKTNKSLSSIKDIISAAKAQPGEIKFALSVVGGSWWMAGMLLQSNTKTTFKNIPQEGSGAVVISQLSGGHTEVGVSGVAAAASQVAAGNLKIVATFGSKRLLGKYANIPTLIESGVDVNWDSPNFIIGPPGIPKPIVDKFNKAIEEALQNSEVIKIASEMGASPVFKSPELLSKYLDNQKMVSIDILKMNALLK